MENESEESVQLQEIVADALTKQSTKEGVDVDELLASLKDFEELPEDMEDEDIDKLFEVLFNNCPALLKTDK